MTQRTVRIGRLVLKGTAVDPRHAERLRGLVHDELVRLLDGGAVSQVVDRVPASSEPEHLAGPVAREIVAKLPDGFVR